MYPPRDRDEDRADVSQDNPRDIVEAIHQLILLCIVQQVNGIPSQDQIEVCKRQITDYLLVTDPRAGVFRSPVPEKPSIGQ